MALSKRIKIKPIVWVVDFETNANHDGIIYRWAVRDINKQELIFGWTIDDYIEWTNTLIGNHVIYAHNGGGFDWHFILNWMINKKVQYNDGAKKNNSFDAMIDDSKNIYQIRIRTKKARITLWDSYKLTNSSLADMGHGGKDLWKPYMVQRWTKWRLINCDLVALLDEYLALDVNIVADLLRDIWNFTNGNIAMTAASTAMNSFKVISDKLFKDHLYNKMTMNEFALMKNFYRGGYTYCNPTFRFKHMQHKLFIYDVNSLYPSVMMSDKIYYPIGHRFDLGYDFDDFKTYPVQFCEISFDSATIKKNRHPWIQTQTRKFGESSYASVIDTYDKDDKLVRTSKYLTYEEYKQFMLDYTSKGLRIERVHGYKAMLGSEIFGDYIEVYKTLKETSKGAIRTYAKIMLNSLYGKFGSNPERDGYTWKEDHFEKVRNQVKDKNIYLTMIAAKITSEARLITIRAMQANSKNFVYADTDSLHLLEKAKDIEIDANKFGCWKFENEFDEFIYAGQKRYRHDKKNGYVEIKCGGLNKQFHYLLTYDKFKNGMIIPNGKLSLKPKTLGEIPLASYSDFTFIDYE